MRIFFSNAVRHNHELHTFDLAIGSPALLSILDAILDRHEEKVQKDLAGQLETDAVLALIGEVLGLIPFETNSVRRENIIT